MHISKKTDWALLLLRLVFGGFMIFGHGWPKLARLFGGEEIKFIDPFGLGPLASLGLATFAETICALLLMLGLFSRYVTIPLIITMLFAAFFANADAPFGKKEMALLYLTGYVALALTGPGWYSLDARWREAE